MSADSDRRWLEHMLDSARRATVYVATKTETEFYADVLLQDATAWRVTIIGEAARCVSDHTRHYLGN